MIWGGGHQNREGCGVGKSGWVGVARWRELYREELELERERCRRRAGERDRDRRRTGERRRGDRDLRERTLCLTHL